MSNSWNLEQVVPTGPPLVDMRWITSRLQNLKVEEEPKPGTSAEAKVR